MLVKIFERSSFQYKFNPIFMSKGLVTKNEYSSQAWLHDFSLILFYAFSNVGD